MRDHLKKEIDSIDTRRLHFSWASLFSFGVVAFFVWMLWLSRNFDFKTGLFPITVAVTVLIFACIQLVRDLLGKDLVDPDPELHEVHVGRELVIRRSLTTFGWIIGYFVAIWLFSFAIGGALCTFVHLKFGARERWPITLLITFIAWGAIFFFFDGILHTPFPPGKLFEWLSLAGTPE
jgi:Tripartite tricarboxylate transporter TctB family